MPDREVGDRVRFARNGYGDGTVRDLMFEERRSPLAGVVWSRLSLVSVEFDNGITMWLRPRPAGRDHRGGARVSNIAEMDRVVSFLREHPHKHKQDRWACGTTACVAGWTLLPQLEWAGCTHLGSMLPTTDPDSIIDAARTVLGLSEEEAEVLFGDTIGHIVYRPLPDHCGSQIFGRGPVLRCPVGATAEDRALALMDAIIERDKNSLSREGRSVLEHYELCVEPAAS